MRNLTPEEIKLYRNLISGRFQNFVLVSSEFDGIETGIIAALNGSDGAYETTPLAILINGDVFKKLKSPGAVLHAGKTLVLE